MRLFLSAGSVDGQLKEMQRQYRQMDTERKSYSDDSNNIIRKQRCAPRLLLQAEAPAPSPRRRLCSASLGAERAGAPIVSLQGCD